jgi:hypothetical protein
MDLTSPLSSLSGDRETKKQMTKIARRRGLRRGLREKLHPAP